MSNKPQHYWKLRHLKKWYGRWFEVDKDFPSMLNCAPCENLVLKFPRPKTGVWFWSKRTGDEDRSDFTSLGSDFMYQLEVQRKVIVQERLKLGGEYRIFMIDGKPVAGTPCDSNLNSTHNVAVFDPRLDMSESEIGQKHKTINDTLAALSHEPGIVGQYVDLAKTHIGPTLEWKDYVMDFATDLVFGNPVLLEINPPWWKRVDFYACSQEQVMLNVGVINDKRI